MAATDPPSLYELALTAGPFALVATLTAIGWLLKLRMSDGAAYEKSKAAYRARVTELENQISEQRELRLQEFKSVTTLIANSTNAQLVQAAAMDARSKSSAELTDVNKELLIYVKTLIDSVKEMLAFQKASRGGGGG